MGPIALGATHCRLRDGRTGIIAAWRAPHFVIACGGTTQLLRASRVAEGISCSLETFLDPAAFYYDFSVIHPSRIGGWSAGLSTFLQRHGAALPQAWLRSPSSGNKRKDTSVSCATAAAAAPCLSAADFCVRERARLRDEFQRLAGASRAESTLEGLRNPGLKLLWFLASRGHSLPPSQWALTDYLTLLAVDVGNMGAIRRARGALLHLCRINGWSSEPYTSGVALIPGAAMARITRHQVKKAAGLALWMVERIVDVYCFERPHRAAQQQWELAYGAAIVISFKVFARWDDAAQLRWDDDHCEVHELYVRFFLEHRKNAQAQGNFVDVARRQNPSERSAYHIIREAKRVFQRGFVLPYISAKGLVDSTRCMPYSNHIRHLRSCLMHIGVPRDEAEKFAGQSARAGAATCAARAGVPPHEICRLAGVRSIGWHLGYMRPDFEDRMQASWAVGL